MNGVESHRIVALDVGGVYFETTEFTLSKCEVLRKNCENNDSMFVDRDPSLFTYVLNYLRNGVVCVHSDSALIEILLLEARYFQLPSMEAQLQEKLKSARLADGGLVEVKQAVYDLRQTLCDLNSPREATRVLRRRAAP